MDDLLARKGLSLDRLRSFLALADAGGIARAAPGQPVRQSQLSRQLKELETALGRALFLRTGRKLLLTEAGARLARTVRELQHGLNHATAPGARVVVRLAAGDSALCWLVLPALKRLLGACPALDLTTAALAAEDAVHALEDHEIDLALMRMTPSAGALKTVRLGQVGYALFARQGLEVATASVAIATTERSLLPMLAKLKAPTVACETFTQVGAAVRSGSVAGVLPTYARRELRSPDYRMAPLPQLDAAASPLLLAWGPRLDALRPELTPVRRALEQVVRAQLSG